MLFRSKPWETGTEAELCGAQFCFELRDKEHSVYAYYEESGEKGSMALEVSLQKLDDYKEYVKKFIEFDLPSIPLDAPNELNGDFYIAYKSAVMLHKERKRCRYTQTGKITTSLSHLRL